MKPRLFLLAALAAIVLLLLVAGLAARPASAQGPEFFYWPGEDAVWRRWRSDWPEDWVQSYTRDPRFSRPGWVLEDEPWGDFTPASPSEMKRFGGTVLRPARPPQRPAWTYDPDYGHPRGWRWDSNPYSRPSEGGGYGGYGAGRGGWGGYGDYDP